MGCFNALGFSSHQGYPDSIFPWVAPVRGPGEEFTGKYLDVGVLQESLREQLVVNGGLQPKIESRLWNLHWPDGRQYLADSCKFLTINLAVLYYVGLIFPGCSTDELVVNGHGGTMVGSVKQEAFQQFGVSGNVTGANTWEIRAFG